MLLRIQKMPPNPSSSTSNVETDRPSTFLPPRSQCCLTTTSMKKEIDRLNTFKKWPKHYPISPEKFAASGFYYTLEVDNVRCPFCGIEISNWEPNEDPLVEHKKYSSTCDFIVDKYNCGNIPLNESTTPTSLDESYDTCGPYAREIRPFSGPERCSGGSNKMMPDLQSLGVTKAYKPSAPKYCTIDTRRKSFVGWPKGLPQKPEQLAEAGFYYTGMGDAVKCFYCGGGLNNWEPTDDPWVEHARWFTNCSFVKIQKGQDFINEVSKHLSAVIPYEAIKSLEKPDVVPSEQKNEKTEDVESLLSKTFSEKVTLQSTSSSPSTSSDTTSLCKVCFDQERSIVFLPCGHLVCCTSCASSISKCAVCRRDIEAVVRAYLQ